jgi:hypothetical protein
VHISEHSSRPGLEVQSATGLGFGRDGNFYVADALGNKILRYDGQNGTFLGVFATNGLNYPEG